MKSIRLSLIKDTLSIALQMLISMMRILPLISSMLLSSGITNTQHDKINLYFNQLTNEKTNRSLKSSIPSCSQPRLLSFSSWFCLNLLLWSFLRPFYFTFLLFFVLNILDYPFFSNYVFFLFHYNLFRLNIH